MFVGTVVDLCINASRYAHEAGVGSEERRTLLSLRMNVCLDIV